MILPLPAALTSALAHATPATTGVFLLFLILSTQGHRMDPELAVHAPRTLSPAISPG